MRVPQPSGSRGSLKWIQELINSCPSVLNENLSSQLNLEPGEIDWLSPLETDKYAEYSDDDFLVRLGLGVFKERLRGFWPRRGPQWDALGRDRDNKRYFLVEAKANIPEIISTTQAKSESSVTLIKNTLLKVQDYLNCKASLNWEAGFYQYANRIAHLYFLREICKVDALLVFLYFMNDHTHIPTSMREWDGAIEPQKRLMGLNNHKMQRFVVDVFIDVKEIKNSEDS